VLGRGRKAGLGTVRQAGPGTVLQAGRGKVRQAGLGTVRKAELDTVRQAGLVRPHRSPRIPSLRRSCCSRCHRSTDNRKQRVKEIISELKGCYVAQALTYSSQSSRILM
jgi:hypothetical protein